MGGGMMAHLHIYLKNLTTTLFPGGEATTINKPKKVQKANGQGPRLARTRGPMAAPSGPAGQLRCLPGYMTAKQNTAKQAAGKLPPRYSCTPS